MTDNVRDLSATLDELCALLDDGGAGPSVAGEVKERALAIANGGFGRGAGAATPAILACAAELLALAAAKLAEQPPLASELIGQVEQLTGAGRMALAHEALRAPRLLELHGDAALGAQLGLVLAFAGASAVTLWVTSEPGDEDDDGPQLLAQASASGLVRARTRNVARGFLETFSPPAPPFAGIIFNRWRGSPAAVLADDAPDGTERFLHLAVPVLSTMLARQQERASEQTSQQNLFTAVERRLARLRFDLHDGPQQDVTLLAMDLALFREQLLPIIAEHPDAHRVLGRLDDLAAQLVALDGDLRRLSANVQSPFLHTGSLGDALREMVEAFEARTAIRPNLSMAGEFSGLSESQQLTLLALIREALSNIREHSEAENVTIDIVSDAEGLRAEVTDDGHGFEPETTLVRAARDGHLGLVGMHERVRMLGGETQIDSRPGGPTVVSVMLPRWTGPGSTA
jgi:signal transduction histidine kinase